MAEAYIFHETDKSIYVSLPLLINFGIICNPANVFDRLLPPILMYPVISDTLCKG